MLKFIDLFCGAGGTTEGIQETKNVDAIRTAFYKLAKIHHPDYGGDSSTFIKIKKSFEEGICMAAL